MRAFSPGLPAAACGLVLAALAWAESPPATQVIERLNAALLDTLKDAEKLGYEGRVAKLTPAVGAAFDVEFMAEKSIGRHWKSLSDADKTRWIALFKEFTAANYAGNLKKFSGQRFEISGEEPSQNDTTTVRSVIVDPGSENTEMNYRMHQTPAGPKVIDIYLKGTVSELALRRSDYTSVLERDGFEGLVTTIRGKISDLAAGRAKGK
jgi:phospholipid transport system substrate-binding protein